MNVNLIVTDKLSAASVSTPLVVEGQISIGRHLSSPVPLEGFGLSRDHFSLEARDGALFVEDLSSNGTWLNGQRLSSHQAVPAQHGDVIEVPGYRIEISIPGTDGRPESSSPTHSPSSEEKAVAPWFNTLKAVRDYFNAFEVALIVSALFTVALILYYVSL